MFYSRVSSQVNYLIVFVCFWVVLETSQWQCAILNIVHLPIKLNAERRNNTSYTIAQRIYKINLRLDFGNGSFEEIKKFKREYQFQIGIGNEEW